MRILAIETSCDETGASVVEKKDGEQFVRVLSNVTASSISLHAKTGGIIPEYAAREQIKAIIPVMVKTLNESGSMSHESWGRTERGGNYRERRSAAASGARQRWEPERQDLRKDWEKANEILKNDIDAIAVTHGPGLIGSLLVGVETAKTLSFAFKKPIVPVHHLLAHLFANFIRNQDPRTKIREPNFPFIGLIVSGGHTDLLLFESVTKFKWLGGTRDDAAGEALDKIGRLLGLPYPAGAEIERRSSIVRKSSINFKSPLLSTDDFDFSFSGLKTEISRFISTLPAGRQEKHLTDRLINEVCYALQDAIFKVLINKTIRAAKLYKMNQIALGGGVSANQTLRNEFKLTAKSQLPKAKIFSPEKKFATDNAAMIGAYALLNYNPVPWEKITTEPDLYFD